MLKDADIDMDRCHIGNVFTDRPKDNKLEHFCCDLKTAREEMPGYDLPSISKNSYIHPNKLWELERLRNEICALKPTLIMALGATATLALLGTSGLLKLRGTLQTCELAQGFKVLPTFHPAHVLRFYENRPVCVADFMKAKLEASYPEIRRPKRQVWIEPTLGEIRYFKTTYLDQSVNFSVDTETKRKQITCIGFAPSASIALVVPFVDHRQASGSYWKTLQEELEAWGVVRDILALPQAKILQNALYDIQYLWRSHGIVPKGRVEDTMLLHHAFMPEMRKGLDFLGSIYTNETNWKQMRKNKGEELKRDE